MTSRPRVLAGVCAMVSLGVLGGGAPALAQDPPPVSVDVAVVGTPEDLDWVRGLAPRLTAGGARWSRVDKLDPADVLRERRDGRGPAVRAWVDMTVATRVRLTFATQSGDRFVMRDVELSGRFEEVDRAALGEVLESSIGALLANERAGLTRAEAEAVLARQGAPAASLTVAPPTTPPPTQPPPESSPSRWAIGLFYGAQALAGDALDHGPGVTLSVAGFRNYASVHHTGRGPAIFVSAQYRLPVHERASPVGLALDTLAARAGVECGPLGWSRLRVRLGAGADFVHVSPESSDPTATLTAAHWSTSFVGSAALRANLARPSRQFWLSAVLAADVLPTAVRYQVAIDGTTTPVFSPWRVRPGLSLELTFF